MNKLLNYIDKTLFRNIEIENIIDTILISKLHNKISNIFKDMNKPVREIKYRITLKQYNQIISFNYKLNLYEYFNQIKKKYIKEIM